jgi:hypothetical protein
MTNTRKPITDMTPGTLEYAARSFTNSVSGIENSLADTAHMLVCASLFRYETENFTRAAVAQARAEGMSWAAIAEPLHMTKQAAQQRFGRDS